MRTHSRGRRGSRGGEAAAALLCALTKSDPGPARTSPNPAGGAEELIWSGWRSPAEAGSSHRLARERRWLMGAPTRLQHVCLCLQPYSSSAARNVRVLRSDVGQNAEEPAEKRPETAESSGSGGRPGRALRGKQTFHTGAQEEHQENQTEARRFSFFLKFWSPVSIWSPTALGQRAPEAGLCAHWSLVRRWSGESGEHPAGHADRHSTWSRQEQGEERVRAQPRPWTDGRTRRGRITLDGPAPSARAPLKRKKME